MPEHKSGHWEPLPNPSYEELALCQEVYQIWPTGEIFTDYEKYCERLFLYNQPEWTCRYSGKSGLTFQDALISEDRMRKSLDAFPETWKGPLLAFVQHATASIEQISMQFMDFVRNNFIPGEEVKIDFDGKKMNAKIISSSQVPDSTEVSYRLEIFQDDNCTELIGEANVIGSASFTRERLNLNRAMIKRYVRNVAMRKSPNLPWFIPDYLAAQYGIAIELPEGITPEMKPAIGPDGQFARQAFKPAMLSGMKSGSGDQMSIDEFFGGATQGGSSMQPSAMTDSLPQFNFPCDDAQVPAELIDPELKYPTLGPVNQFISNSALLTRSTSIWAFLQTFSSLLQLSPFPYDDWEESITCTDPSIVKNPLLEETMLALLSTLMKDRRNLTKAAFAERIKSLVLSFSIESETTAKSKLNEANCDGNNENPETAAVSEDDDKPEVIVFSDEDDSEPFVKRARQSKPSTTSALLPSIDLRRHRWYETKAMDQWHFVLASFFLEALDMIREEFNPDSHGDVGVDEGEGEGESDSETKTEAESKAAVDNSDQETASPKGDGNNEANVAIESVENEQIAAIKAAKTEAISSFIDTFDAIIHEYTKEGSRHLFTRFMTLSLHAKFCLIEFLIHANYDREPFKAHIEDCLEQQAELRRQKREVEGELNEVSAQVEALESKVAVLKAENAEITDRLAADDEIALSGDEDDSSEAEEEEGAEPMMDESSSPSVPPAPKEEPLTEQEREELTAKRTANKKEINSLNASLRRIRPEHTGLQRRFDNICRDLRKAASFRTFPLGEDRDGRIYWWFGDFVQPMPRILVASAPTAAATAATAAEIDQCEWIGAIDSPEGLDQLMAWLNALGIREAKLKCALMECEAELRQFLEPRNLPIEEPEESADATEREDDDEEAEEEEIVVKKRGRGRPKGSFGSRKLAARERPFQRYKNTM